MLEIKDLAVAYGNREIVHNVDFSVQPGETVCIVGESGSGKSTLLKAIAGLLGQEGHITGGRIEFDGRNLARQIRKNTEACAAPDRHGLPACGRIHGSGYADWKTVSGGTEPEGENQPPGIRQEGSRMYEAASLEGAGKNSTFLSFDVEWRNESESCPCPCYGNGARFDSGR